MPSLLAEPEGGPRGAVLVINDVFGRSPFYENLARRLATAGFVALDPEYFFRQGPLAQPTREAAMARRGRLDHAQAVVDLNAALDHLKEKIGGGRLGTIGFCMGGTFVMQLAARRDDLASVCFYGFPGQLDSEERKRINGPLAGFFARNGELDEELCDYFASFQQVVSFLFDPDGIFEANLALCGVEHFLAAHNFDFSTRIRGGSIYETQRNRPVQGRRKQCSRNVTQFTAAFSNHALHLRQFRSGENETGESAIHVSDVLHFRDDFLSDIATFADDAACHAGICIDCIPGPDDGVDDLCAFVNLAVSTDDGILDPNTTANRHILIDDGFLIHDRSQRQCCAVQRAG